MSHPHPEAVWVNVSPTLSVFDRPLLQHLAHTLPIARWDYSQTLDEACSSAIATMLLHDYLKSQPRPVHLIGHGAGGAIALLYARQHPERVRSLSLLAVAEQPALTWHSHYYIQRKLLPCSQERLLAQTVQHLFDRRLPYPAQYLIQAFRCDLLRSPLNHSLFHISTLPRGGVEVPLFICGSGKDIVVHPPILENWTTWLKPEDSLLLHPYGGHFFHYFYPEEMTQRILGFWQLNQVTNRCLLV